MKPKLCWSPDYYMLNGATMSSYSIGNAYGYTRHMAMMRNYMEQLIEWNVNVDTILHIASGDKYYPITGKKNILFTMFEAEQLPKSYIRAINDPDTVLIVVPCTQNQRVFSAYTEKPVEVCWEGVEIEKYTFVHRNTPIIAPFRFLWIGAPNPRKGYEEVLVAWDVLFKQLPNVELYIKTTSPAAKVEYRGNVTFDSRNLSESELIKLYQTAHVFLFPTRGEGFGLTLAEAMATGLPCIATEYGGPEDFFSDTVGYPISFDMETVEFRQYELEASVAKPQIKHLIMLMLHIMKNYKEARRKGVKAAARIRSKYTWPIAAKRMVNILEERGLI